MSADELPNGFASMNDAADFWYYKIGVNVIPANTKIKKANLIPTWTPWQTQSIPEDVYQGWKDEGLFELGGMGIILGKVWRGKHEGDYIGGIDTDNAKALEEVCTFKGEYTELSEWAKEIIIEQHKDDPKKAHWIMFLDRPFVNKSSDVNGPLADRLSSNEIPAIEVKGFSELLYVSPSVHKNGCRYGIIGTLAPNKSNAEKFEQHIDNICRKYGIKYLENVSDTVGTGAGAGNNKSQVPMDDLFEEDFVIHEGHNRHKALMRIMESLIKNNRGIWSEETLKHMARVWNDKHCKPPLNDTDFYRQWQDAKDFIARVKKIEDDQKNYYHKTAEEVDKMPLGEKINYLLGSINNVHPKEMIERFHFKCMIDTRELYYYDNVKHAYVDNGGITIEQELEANYLAISKIYAKVGAIIATISEEQLERLEASDILDIHKEKSWSRGLIDDFQGHIERYPGVFMDRNKFNPDKEWMAFSNCMVNLLTKDTSDFSPEYLNTTRIPVVYTGDVYATGLIADFWNWVIDPIISSGPCPKIRKFLFEIMAPEDVELLLDFVAYCLWRDMPYHKWLILRGEGLNGKGTLLTLIRVFLGLENVAGESLTRLLENTWSTAQLYGKLANIDADISKEGLKNTGLLKKLSGNDPIPAENKFQKPFWFQNYAKLILSANEIPETPDETDAFFRRPVIINMIDQFLGSKMDAHLIDKLTEPEELSGLLWILLERLPKVIIEGNMFQVSQDTITQTREKYMQGTHQVRAFAESCLEYHPEGVSDDENMIKASKHEVHDAYLNYCHHHHLTPSSESSLSRSIVKECQHEWPGLAYKQIGSKKNRITYWIGLKIKAFKPTEDDEQETLL